MVLALRERAAAACGATVMREYRQAEPALALFVCGTAATLLIIAGRCVYLYGVYSYMLQRY